jgi:predicted amidohydrolase YtcJ
VKGVLESGGLVAFGSDWSVSTANPFPQMEVAVRPADPRSDNEESLTPGQKIPLADAVAAFTINGAYANRIDDETGSLEVGKAADLIVLDRNLFSIDAAEISETSVLVTMIEGRIVYSRLSDFPAE